MVKVTEFKEGFTIFTTYYFVIDSNKLVHIATSTQNKISKFKTRVIIELKNLDIDNQIIPYKQIFQSDIEIATSLKKVQISIKQS